MPARKILFFGLATAPADNAAADNAAGHCPTMWPVYTAPPAGTSRADAGHVGGLGGGRGALEALIARSAARAPAGATAAAAEESPAAEATPANLEVEIAYTRQPSSAARCGARAGAGARARARACARARARAPAPVSYTHPTLPTKRTL